MAPTSRPDEPNARVSMSGGYRSRSISNGTVARMTRPTVMLPWANHREVLGGVTTGLDVSVYDGGTEPPTDELGAIRFYATPYMAGVRTMEIMRELPALAVVQTLTAGVDHVWPYLPVGVRLHNAAGVHDASTAELVVGLILAKLRRIDDFARAQQTGEWLYGRYDALADKHVVIVGYGNVGRAVEQRLRGFEVGMTRVARSPRTTEDGLVVRGFVDLPDVLPTADVVVLVVPQTSETVGMVDAEFLARMKDGALLVNASRGPVVVTDALLAEVQSGRLHAALDVTDPEPLPADHPLWRAPGVLISPHVGGNTSAFLPRAYRLVADQLRRFLAGEPLLNEVARP